MNLVVLVAAVVYIKLDEEGAGRPVNVFFVNFYCI